MKTDSMIHESNTLETLGTLLVGVVGIVLPQIVQGWATFIVSILTGVWILVQIIDKVRGWRKK